MEGRICDKLLSDACDRIGVITSEKLFADIAEQGTQSVINGFIYGRVEDSDLYYQLAGAIIMWEIYANSPLTIYGYVRKFEKMLAPGTALQLLLHQEELEKCLNFEVDFGLDYFAAMAWKNAYLHTISIDSQLPEEVPQMALMRACVGLMGPNGGDIDMVIRAYGRLSSMQLGLATPSLLNLGMAKGTPTSCVIMSINDNLEDIQTVQKNASWMASQNAGLGINFTRLRRSAVRGREPSVALYQHAKSYEASLNCINRGGRKATLCLTIHDFHRDFFDILQKADKEQKEFFSLIVVSLQMSDLFWKRVAEDGDWTMFCPKQAARLTEVYGKRFEDLYCHYEEEAKKFPEKYNTLTMKAQKIGLIIADIQRRNGHPFIVHRDPVNNRNPQKHFAIIDGPNLCQEIMLPSPPEKEVAACNLCSVNLSKIFVNDKVDFNLLHSLVRDAVNILNLVIDRSEDRVLGLIRASNNRARPIGIGVAGLTDLLYQLRLPLITSSGALNPEVIELNNKIWSCIYFSALEASCEQASLYGPCPGFDNSPASKGILQFDMASEDGAKFTLFEPKSFTPDISLSWNELKEKIITIGLRNMNLVSIQPTATSAQILSVNENVELPISHMYVRKLATGEYVVINSYLLKDLKERGLWNEEVRLAILRNDGSIQNIPSLQEHPDLKRLYLTMFEVPQKYIVHLAAVRQPYIDHSQSMSLFFRDISPEDLLKVHQYTNLLRLKTGIYYCHGRGANNNVRLQSLNKENEKNNSNSDNEVKLCMINDPSCVACSS